MTKMTQPQEISDQDLDFAAGGFDISMPGTSLTAQIDGLTAQIDGFKMPNQKEYMIANGGGLGFDGF